MLQCVAVGSSVLQYPLVSVRERDLLFDEDIRGKVVESDQQIDLHMCMCMCTCVCACVCVRVCVCVSERER